ncbi:MAG: O-antigen ligase family protein [Chitinophagaceae bacterium]
MDNNDFTYKKGRISSRLSTFLQKTFLLEKLNNWLGYIIFISIAIFFGYLMAQQTSIGLGLIALIFGIAVVLTCMLNAETGLYLILIYSFFISHFNRLFFYDTLQVGVFSDILVGATFLGFFIRNVNLKKSFNQFTQTSVVITLLFVYAYTAIEVFNPSGSSLTGWIPAFRKILATLLILFISFNVFNSLSSVKRFINVLFILCVLVGIYGCVQEWHGFFQFETDWIFDDDKRARMIFVNGGARKMSFFPDALSLSIAMATCSVFFIAIATGKKKLQNKIAIITGVIFMILSMSFSLTRTANAMLVAGLFIFMLITLDKKTTRIFAILSAFLFLIILYGPYSNSHIGQFRLTFRGGTKDASFNVREINRKSIQPYIYSHPIGGGLSTTGGEGLTYNPGHPLAGFPPDSGYLKKALELGWIGFGLILFLYFLVLKTGIKGYFKCKNEEIRLIYAACTAACFSLYTGDFSQVAIGQITDVVIYYPIIAIILKLKNFDQTIKTE